MLSPPSASLLKGWPRGGSKAWQGPYFRCGTHTPRGSAQSLHHGHQFRWFPTNAPTCSSAPFHCGSPEQMIDILKACFPMELVPNTFPPKLENNTLLTSIHPKCTGSSPVVAHLGFPWWIKSQSASNWRSSTSHAVVRRRFSNRQKDPQPLVEFSLPACSS